MPIVVPPRGTRGFEWRKMPRPVFRFMLWLLHHAYRAFGARMRVQGLPVIELETIGAKSGAKRYSVVVSLPDAAADDAVGSESKGSWLVVAAAAGAARHPAWFLNLARHPDQVWISAGGRRIKVRPETLEGAEFEEAWRAVALKAPGIGRYRETTDRVIPLVRLRAEEDGQ
jgi:deazaflavin-dependent oxidoreductase (nitroreductase family)